MIAASPGHVARQNSVVVRPPENGAEDLARAYLRYVSGCWCGNPEAERFGERLSTFFRGELPSEPVRSPDAVSPHGGGGRGIRWYQCGNEVRGYLPGVCGGYQVPNA